MSSLFNHGLIRTVAVERVVAPLSCHLCHLVLLCENTEEAEPFRHLEEAGRAVANATEQLAAQASRRMSETEDEMLQMEMSSLLDSVWVSGQHVLLAAQKLHIQPGVSEHQEELISATHNVFLIVLKVLLVDDDATIRRVVAAADSVLERLSQLGSSLDLTSLLASFQTFSDALLLLHRLTTERANSLLDPEQTEQLLESLDTLRRCISMLHTAMITTIKHPACQQAQEAKSFILDKVQSTVSDIIITLNTECRKRTLGPFGYYTGRRTNLLQVLQRSSPASVRNSALDSLARDLVFHCMLVANSSCREFQQRVVGHCRHVLQLWSDIRRILKSETKCDEQRFEKTSTLLVQQIQTLDKDLMTTVFYQVLDTFLTAFPALEELSRGIRRTVAAEDSKANVDLSFIQPLVEDLISSTDKLTQVANFTSAVAADAKTLENVENSRVCLTRLRAQIAPLSLELADNSLHTVQKLHDMCRKCEEEMVQLQDAVSDVLDVRDFTNIAIGEMVSDRHGCDAAYREQSYEQFHDHAANLLYHMKMVVHSVRRHLNRSNEPIYRNGLLVLLRQAQASQSRVAESVRAMLLDSRLNVEVYSTFSDNISTVIQHFGVLREGLDGQQHPHLLSPLREVARQPEVSQDTEDLSLELMMRDSESPVLLEDTQRDSHDQLEEDDSDEETIEAELPRKYDREDLKFPGASKVSPKLIHRRQDFDLLPLLHEVVTVTKEKDVTALNQACTGVLQISNYYVQATKDALAVVDAVDCQTLDSFRAELVSLTPLLTQTAQETAMSSAMSTENLYKHSTHFSDLINNIRRILLPVAGSWYHAVHAELQGNPPAAGQQLNQVMILCAEVVQLLTSSDLTSQGPETFNVLHNKLNRTQNTTRSLLEFCSSPGGTVDQREGLCLLWGLSVQILLNSLDRILGTYTTVNQLSPQKQLSALSENSLRMQEAARVTALTSKSVYKSKQLEENQEELKSLTEVYLRAAEELGLAPGVLHLAKSEFFQRRLLIKIRSVSGSLSKVNKDYEVALKNVVGIAHFAAEHVRENLTEETNQRFENATKALEENVRSASKRVEESLNYVKDPRARSDLRSINDHLNFQISNVLSRARLLLETHYVCDSLSLDVQIQSWAAKAHHLVEEIKKQDGIHPEAKDHIRAGLQGRTPEEGTDVVALFPSKAKEEELPSSGGVTSWQKIQAEAALSKQEAAVSKQEAGSTLDVSRLGASTSLTSTSLTSTSLTSTSLFLKRESDSWDPKDNRIVQVTCKMADTICHMTQYLKKKGPIPSKEAFVAAAKQLISSSQTLNQFIRVIAAHCLDPVCTEELSLILEQILTISSQLSIISSVNSVTPGSKSSDEILVKNAQNLLHIVLRGVHAAETACIKGLKQPEPDSDGAEFTALCFQWRRNLELHRAQQSRDPHTDELGLRKTSAHPEDPSLAPSLSPHSPRRAETLRGTSWD